MNLTSKQLYALLAANPADQTALSMLRMRVRTKLIRAMPSPTATCVCGLKVTRDDKGAYSSGYWLHPSGVACPGSKFDIDPDPPKIAKLRALLEELRSSA